MKPTSRNSIPRVFFRFAPMWKGEKTRFELNWTIIDNNGFLPCLEKTTQDGGMKPTSWNSIPRVFFRFPRWGKSNIRIFNAIGRPSSTRLFALLLKAHPKWWYETDHVELDPKRVFSFRPDGESRKNAFSPQLDDLRQSGFLRCLEKPTRNGGMKPTSWNSITNVFFRLTAIGKVEKHVLNAIGRPSSTRLFALRGKAYPKWWYETDLVEFDPKGVF